LTVAVFPPMRSWSRSLVSVTVVPSGGRGPDAGLAVTQGLSKVMENVAGVG
jgi:hypothetical protein